MNNPIHKTKPRLNLKPLLQISNILAEMFLLHCPPAASLWARQGGGLVVAGGADVRHADGGAALHRREPQEDHREDPQGEAQPPALPDARRQGPHQKVPQTTGTLTSLHHRHLCGYCWLPDGPNSQWELPMSADILLGSRGVTAMAGKLGHLLNSNKSHPTSQVIVCYQ